MASTTCRLLSLAAALFVVLPTATLASPVVGGVLDINLPSEETCVEFGGAYADHYCTRFNNRRTALFPNPRKHKTIEEADKEFRDFIPLLQSGCHEKLGTLLCFMYFPFCQAPGQANLPDFKIYPCTEVCEDVTAPDSQCTAILNSYNVTWNDALQCNRSFYKSMGSTEGFGCASGAAPLYGSVNATMPPSESTEAPSTTAPPTEATTTAGCPQDKDCEAGECDYRDNANGGTLKNNDYCFAAKVTVKSYDPQGCKHAYTVTVEEQYDLLTPFNATHATKAPEMGESALIFISEHCRDCPKFETDKTYLVAGLYSKASDGSVNWQISGAGKKTSLVSGWINKYRKIDGWIARANADVSSRTAGECEKELGLVSAEQWHRI